MAFPYSDNFDADTPGLIAPGWANVGSSAFVVGTVNPVTAPNSFGEAAPANADIALYTAEGLQSDQNVFYVTQPYTGSGKYRWIDPVFYSDALSTTVYYIIAFSFNAGNAILYRVTGGVTYTPIGATQTVPVYADGTNVCIKARTVGNQFSFKQWIYGNDEPLTWVTPASWTSALPGGGGYPGLRYNWTAGLTGVPQSDNFYISTDDNFVIDSSTPGTSAADNSVSMDITLTPRVAYTGTITLPAHCAPSTLTWAASSAAKKYTVTPPDGLALVRYRPVATNNFYAQLSVPISPKQFVRIQDTPILLKGGSYGGWAADALAAPGVMWDAANSRYVMVVSLWSIANAQWASAWFTSINLTTWTYVPGSLQVPTGGAYILGNGTVCKPLAGTYANLYYHICNQYPGTTSATVWLYTSPDLVTWTKQSQDVLGGGTLGYDPGVVINPVNGYLELTVMNSATPRQVDLYTSTDHGATFAHTGVVLNPDVWNGTNLGTPQYSYDASNNRYLTADGSEVDGYRYNCLWYQSYAGAGVWNALTTLGIANVPKTPNAWESVATFDMTPLGMAVDRGDGRGVQLWAIYAGSDIAAAVDATNSSLGLAYLSPAVAAPGSGSALKSSPGVALGAGI